jgi:integrase
MEEAVQAAVDVAFQLHNDKPSPQVAALIGSTGSSAQDRKTYQKQIVTRQPRKQRIEDAIESFLKEEQKRVDVGLLAQKTQTQKRITLTLHLLPYLKNHKCISYTNQIKETTFRDYSIFRANATPLTRNNEISQIKDFCKNYLVKHRLLSADLLMDRDFLKRNQIKQVDKMRNPAICSEDWEVIVRYIRGEYRNSALNLPNHRIHYWRTLFWHWILFAKNSGMSPEEILRLKWKQIEIVDEGRINSKGERETWEVAYIYTIRSKTKQAREIPVNQARELRRWKKLQEQYLNTHAIDTKISKETLVFGNPHNSFKAYGYSNYQRSWREAREALQDKLKGHRFSHHHYTIYSMRSTFIEDHLLKGTPVFEVAEMAGHSVTETQKTYAKLNLRKKGAEITLPQLGKQVRHRVKADLFE